MTRLAAALLICVITISSGTSDAQGLKVYVLAGQSNMQGHAKVETFDYIGDDEKTAPWLEEMRGADGRPRARENVWISYLTGGRDGNGEGIGKLTAGYGARKNPSEDGGKIGPELTFGIRMDQATADPILIIKTAWGGKSLHTDFRPPSAGPYEFTAKQLENFTKRKKDIKKARADKLAATGVYYRLMIQHVKHVLADIKRVCPDYDETKGFELAGFVWFQGWNDMVDSGTYPNRAKAGGYDQYSQWMTAFIRDVRKDLSAPALPFVIGVMGVGGPLDKYEVKRNKATHGNFRAAMAAPAARPEFTGNVVAVQTAPYWDRRLATIDAKIGKVRQMARFLRKKHAKHANRNGDMSPADQRAYIKKYRAETVGAKQDALFKRGASNAGYHYLGCAKTMAGIGAAFADALIAMEGQPAR